MDSDLATRAELELMVWELTEQVAHLRAENCVLTQELDALHTGWDTCTHAVRTDQ